MSSSIWTNISTGGSIDAFSLGSNIIKVLQASTTVTSFTIGSGAGERSLDISYTDNDKSKIVLIALTLNPSSSGALILLNGISRMHCSTLGQISFTVAVPCGVSIEIDSKSGYVGLDNWTEIY